MIEEIKTINVKLPKRKMRKMVNYQVTPEIREQFKGWSDIQPVTDKRHYLYNDITDQLFGMYKQLDNIMQKEIDKEVDIIDSTKEEMLLSISRSKSDILKIYNKYKDIVLELEK